MTFIEIWNCTVFEVLKEIASSYPKGYHSLLCHQLI